MSDKVASELVMRCFHARTAAHVFHLGTKSYAQHKALEEFYEEIVGLADSFAEAYQGEYSLLGLEDTGYSRGTSPRVKLTGLQSWITQNRYEVCPRTETFLQNIIDEIVALISRTLYKLANLA